MKQYLVALLVSLSIAAARIKIQGEWCSGTFLHNAVNRCALAHGASRVYVDDYVHLRGAETEAAKCFRACLFNACKLYSDNGLFSSDLAWRLAAVTYHGDIQAFKLQEQIARYCIAQTRIGGNRCDTTEAFVRCYSASSPYRISFVSIL